MSVTIYSYTGGIRDSHFLPPPDSTIHVIEDEIAPPSDLESLSAWRTRLDADAKRLQEDQRWLAITAVRGYLDYSSIQWEAAIDECQYLSPGGRENLKRAVRGLPQALLPEAADPQGCISAWWSLEIRGNYRLTETPVFNEDEAKLLLVGLGVDTACDSALLDQARQVGTFAPAEIKRLEDAFTSGTFARETIREIKDARKKKHERSLKGWVEPIDYITPEVQQQIDDCIKDAKRWPKVAQVEFIRLFNIEVMKPEEGEE